MKTPELYTGHGHLNERASIPLFEEEVLATSIGGKAV